MRARQVVRDYPITLSVSVNGILANFAVAFTQPTLAVFALLFTGAVLLRGRHTVTRMILAGGARVRHHARYHRVFSRSRWRMDDLWKGMARRVAAAGSLSAEVVWPARSAMWRTAPAIGRS